MSLNPDALAELWQQRYEEVTAFGDAHGRVPKQRECASGKWLAKQREKARARRLTAQQVTLLGQLPGFAVDQRGYGHQQHLAAVTDFQTKHGRLPRLTDPGMQEHAQWIKDVRAGKVSLTPGHQRQLNDVGFTASPLRDLQDEFVEHYSAYVAETGRRRVPVRRVTPDHYPLGKRVHRRRQAANDGELSARHREQLEAIAFPWHKRTEHLGVRPALTRVAVVDGSTRTPRSGWHGGR